MSPHVHVALLIIFLNILPGIETFGTGKRNNIFIEAGGFGGYGSFNYERGLLEKGYLKMGVRGGIGTYKVYDFMKAFNPDIIIPLSLNFCYGEVHQVEFDIGKTWSSIVYAPQSDKMVERSEFFSANLGIGYRYQKKENGIFFRMTYSPYLEQWKTFRNWWGVSFGYGF